MIIGGNKDEVIANIKKYTASQELNHKVETNDPIFTEEERKNIIEQFYNLRKHKIFFWLSSSFANLVLKIVNHKVSKTVTIDGLENLKEITTGAIITSNHFNPLDNLIVNSMINKKYHKNIYIVSQETNLRLPGILGYLVRHLNIIPLYKGPNYITKIFLPDLKNKLSQNNFVLIYPEEEMWFNYRLPRPCKRGAYQFASKLDVPIIPCFVEIIDLEESDNEQFNKVRYILHVLKPIYPDPKKTIRQNSIDMAQIDYEQKCEAYEKAYQQKLDYTFSYKDIAGLKKKDN